MRLRVEVTGNARKIVASEDFAFSNSEEKM